MQVQNTRILKTVIEQIYAQKFDDKAYLKNLVENVKTIPTFFYDENNFTIKIELKEDELKSQHTDLSKFYNELQNKLEENHKELVITIQGDEQIYKKLLAKYIDILHFVNKSNTKYYTKKYFKEKILIELQALEDILNYAINNNLVIKLNQQKVEIIPENIPLKYQIESEEEQYTLILCKSIEKFYYFIQTNHYLWINYQNKLYRCDAQFMKDQNIILNAFLTNYCQNLYISKKNITNFFSLVYSNIKEQTVIDRKIQEELKPFIPQELTTKLYLDFDNHNYLVADLKFCYNEVEFNPIEPLEINVNRNLLEESIYLNKLLQSGFLLDEKNKRFIINQNDAIYEFIEEDLQDYLKMSKIYTTENFDQKKVKKSEKTAIGVRVNNHLLEINLKTLPIDAKEIKDILEKYKIHKKFYRLKDGSFLALENNQDIAFINDLMEGMDISYKNLEEKIILPVNRSLYLNKLLKQNSQIEVDTNQSYETILQEINKNVKENVNISSELKEVLRDYQKTGYKWLTALDQYEFGGILADDMGLRKNNSNFICDRKSSKEYKEKESFFSGISELFNIKLEK